MPTFRYDTTGMWCKGNTHVHTLASDGGKGRADLARMYAGKGYDFLFSTDHWVASDTAAEEEDALLWLDGIELNGRDYAGSAYHVVCLGSFTGIDREVGFVGALEAARAQGGLLILAHPHWMGNSLEDARRWRFHGVEIYNHVCRWLNGKGDGAAYWTSMLSRCPDTLAFASDDVHLTIQHPVWNGGWIVVNVPERSREAILDAIRAGNFYSSCGPEFQSIERRGAEVHIATSPVQYARMAGPGSQGKRLGRPEGEPLTEATFEIPEDWGYCYLEIEDAQGRRAWTNSLLVADQ